MSENNQSGEAELATSNTKTEVNKLEKEPTRRRRTVLTSSEDDNDRAFTNEDIAKEAKADTGSETSNETKSDNSTDSQSKNSRTRRKRTTAAEHEAKIEESKEKPKVVAKPSIGSSIPPSFVAQVNSDIKTKTAEDEKKTKKIEKEKTARKRTVKDSTKNKKKPKSDSPRSEANLAYIEADLGEDDGVTLDKKTLKARRGKSRKGKPTGRYTMYAHVDKKGNTQLAITEGRILTEHYVARPDIDETTSIDGNIYLGKVQNVLPGMEAAFVDIGTPKNAVLYRADIMQEPTAGEEVDHEHSRRRSNVKSSIRIEDILKKNQMTMVQVTKNPIMHKGARLTQEVSLAGRFVVLIPNQPSTYGISKRLPDDERRRLRRILDAIRPDDAGLIVRTAAEGATDDELQRDMMRLVDQWNQIKELSLRAAKSKQPTLLYREPDLVMRMIREEFNREYRAIVVDDKKLFEEISKYVEAIMPGLSERVELYEDSSELALFERFHITEQLVKALDRKVWLPSGGSLIIERTEALTVIDVNTGKNVGTTSLEETVYNNNIEAAHEIAHQLRLRDIGGIIVIDFVDMEIEKNRIKLTDTMREALSRDKTRTQVFEVTELGLVQMTRKRLSEGMVESFTYECQSCGGRGFVIEDQMVGGFSPKQLLSDGKSTT
jgi:ribonuclease E